MWDKHIYDRTTKPVTRRQLLSQLDKLRRLDDKTRVPSIEPGLENNLRFFEDQRLMSLSGWGGPIIGRPPDKIDSPEKLTRWIEDLHRSARDSNNRVEKSLTDATEMRGLAQDLHIWLSGIPELREEELVATRALDLARRHVADAMLDFWTTDLREPLKATKRIIAMTSAVYELWFSKMTPDAVKKQLQESLKRRRQEF